MCVISCIVNNDLSKNINILYSKIELYVNYYVIMLINGHDR